MPTRDEKFYDNYDTSNRLSNQILLFDKLESLGYEKNNNNLLTTQKMGVPVTIFLLLMKDALTHLEHENKLIVDGANTLDSITTEEIPNKYGIQLIDRLTPAPLTGALWTRRSVPRVGDSPGISGSTGYQYVEEIIPPNTVNHVDTLFSTTDDEVTINRNYILVRNSNQPENSLIEVFKNVSIFINYANALKDRVKYEINNICTKESISIHEPNLGNAFGRNSGRRGSFTHSGTIAVTIGEATSELMISGRQLIEEFTKGFEQACDYVNGVYKLLLDEF